MSFKNIRYNWGKITSIVSFLVDWRINVNLKRDKNSAGCCNHRLSIFFIAYEVATITGNLTPRKIIWKIEHVSYCPQHLGTISETHQHNYIQP